LRRDWRDKVDQKRLRKRKGRERSNEKKR
jgi:hypothetical protein